MRACLGLSDLDGGKPLFILGYHLPEGWTAWIPTVADAGTFPYFRPNPSGPCGLTEPWHSRPDLLDRTNAPFSAIPYPEAIHAPIRVGDLFEVWHLWY